MCVCVGGGGGVRGGGGWRGVCGGVGVGGCFALGIWIRKRNGIAMDGWRFMNKSPTRLCLAQQQQQQITRWPSLASSRLTGCGKTWFGLIKNKNVGSTPTGGGDSSVVRAPDSWLKGRGFESLLERRENFLLQGRLSVLTLISVSVPTPCYHSST